METESNGKRVGLIVLIIILVLAVLGLGGYIIYDKVLKSDDDISVDNDIEDEAEKEDINTDIEVAHEVIDEDDKSNYAHEEIIDYEGISSTYDQRNHFDGLADFPYSPYDKDLPAFIIPEEFDESAEIEFLNEFLNLSKGIDLSWAVIATSFRSSDGDLLNFNITKGIDLLNDIGLRCELTMEYILRRYNVRDYVIIENSLGGYNIDPFDNFSMTFLEYDIFNIIYNKFFGENLEIQHTSTCIKHNFEGNYVGYYFSKNGTNGFWVESFDVTDVAYDDNTQTYIATMTLNYSEDVIAASSSTSNTAKLTYKKYEDGQIMYVSYIVE